jgi:hypothetical protein
MHVTYHSKALETGVLVIYTSGVLSRDGAEKSGTDSVNWVSSGPIWPIYYRDLKGVPPTYCELTQCYFSCFQI